MQADIRHSHQEARAPASTAQNRAYVSIRRAILNGRFPPGSPLRQEQLAKQFHASRTSVRFAIQSLADDGLVEIGDTRRSFVADISETHAEETFDILAVLEPYSAALAARRATPEDIAELQDLIERMQAAVDDDLAFLELNSKFHRKIHRLSGNRALAEIIERLVDFPTTLYLKLGRSTESGMANDDHRRILKAFRHRDGALAALEMKMHIEYRRREFREQWLEFEGD